MGSMLKLLLLCSFTTSAMAQSVSFTSCGPTAYVHLGDTLAAIQKICPNLSSVDTQQTKPHTQIEEDWMYVIQASQQGAPDAVLKLTIKNNVLTQIKYNNTSVNTTNVCQIKHPGQAPVTLSMTPQTIIDICGKPLTINQREVVAEANHAVYEITPGPFQPVTRLIFKDQKLADIQVLP